jgi:hypothetical protein
MSLVVYRFSHTVADPDLLDHLKFGETIWRTGRIAQPDPFSYTAGAQLWVNHEWLAELIYYLVFAAAGAAGLILVKLALAVSLHAMVYRHLSRGGGAPAAPRRRPRARHDALLPDHSDHGAAPHRELPRVPARPAPHPRDGPGADALALVGAVVFLVWANLHPGFLAGLGVLGIWSGVELLGRWTGRGERRASAGVSSLAIVLTGVGSLAGTAANPYGVHLWTFLLHTATVPRPDITEWQPITVMTRYGLAYLGLVVVSAWGLLYGKREASRARLAVAACSALLPFVAIRHTPLAALALVVLTGGDIGAAWRRWLSARRPPAPAHRRIGAALGVGSAALAGALVLLSLPNFSCIRVEPYIGGSYPARAVSLLKGIGARGNLAVSFDWGLYSIYHLGPDVKVSVDGRRETMYYTELYREAYRFAAGAGDWDALLRNHDTHLALLKRDSPAFNLMRLKQGWSLVYEDSLAGLFGRDDLPLTREIRQAVPPALPPDGAGLCVP